MKKLVIEIQFPKISSMLRTLKPMSHQRHQCHTYTEEAQFVFICLALILPLYFPWCVTCLGQITGGLATHLTCHWQNINSIAGNFLETTLPSLRQNFFSKLNWTKSIQTDLQKNWFGTYSWFVRAVGEQAREHRSEHDSFMKLQTKLLSQRDR